MSKPTDPPFVHEIRVEWGDCDPARIAYTARIPAWALSAINAFWEETIDAGWYQMELDRGFGTPFVHMDLDFRAPITPRHRLHCEVVPTRLGETSIQFSVVGRQGEDTCFEGRFVCVFVTAGSLKKTPPPPEVRATLEKLIDAAAG